jgi:hypothetical protein
MKRAPLVEAASFLLATRDSGYRSTAYAVAEFVDNSLQAGATSVSVRLLAAKDPSYPIELLVVDDGAGMSEDVLSAALVFGGSTRFDDRSEEERGEETGPEDAKGEAPGQAGQEVAERRSRSARGS